MFSHSGLNFQIMGLVTMCLIFTTLPIRLNNERPKLLGIKDHETLETVETTSERKNTKISYIIVKTDFKFHTRNFTTYTYFILRSNLSLVHPDL